MNYAPVKNNKSSHVFNKFEKEPEMTIDNMAFDDIKKNHFLLTNESPYRIKLNDAIKGVEVKSELNTLFFSKKNIDRIQRSCFKRFQR